MSHQLPSSNQTWLAGESTIDRRFSHMFPIECYTFFMGESSVNGWIFQQANVTGGHNVRSLEQWVFWPFMAISAVFDGKSIIFDR